MKFLTTKRFVLLLALMLICAGMGRALADDAMGTAPSRTARDYYNEGTKLLGIQKFAEAEIMFQSALATEDQRVQTAALYNIGHTRFDLGIDFLKKGPDAQKVVDQGNAALVAGDHAIQTADAAMATNDMTRLVNAYLEGRGARHQMRDAEKAVAQAMEVFGNTLRKWQRAADDFKSAAELNPADTNALQNAQVVEQAIAKLVDLTRKMQEMAGMLAGKRSELGKKMSKMKGQMPGFQAPPGGSGGDDDEDDDITPGSLAGLKEKATREGGLMQVQISADQAEQILNGLQIDGKRGPPMNGTQEGKPGDRNRRNW
jgi:tetratricopeptide (TPR) repeat protein